MCTNWSVLTLDCRKLKTRKNQGIIPKMSSIVFLKNKRISTFRNCEGGNDLHRIAACKPPWTSVRLISKEKHICEGKKYAWGRSRKVTDRCWLSPVLSAFQMYVFPYCYVIISPQLGLGIIFSCLSLLPSFSSSDRAQGSGSPPSFPSLPLQHDWTKLVSAVTTSPSPFLPRSITTLNLPTVDPEKMVRHRLGKLALGWALAATLVPEAGGLGGKHPIAVCRWMLPS